MRYLQRSPKRRWGRMSCRGFGLFVVLIPFFAACTTGAAVNSRLPLSVKNWNGHNLRVFDQLVSDLGKLPTSAQQFSAANNLVVECHNLDADVGAAKSLAPFPERAGEKRWTSLLTTMARTARDCLAGGNGRNSILVNRFLSERSTSTAAEIDFYNVATGFPLSNVKTGSRPKTTGNGGPK